MANKVEITTPRPWVLKRSDDGYEVRRVVRGNGDTMNVAAQSQWHDLFNKREIAEADANWQLMVAAVNDHDELARLLRLLADRSANLRAAIAPPSGLRGLATVGALDDVLAEVQTFLKRLPK